MAGHQNGISLCLGHTGGNCANAGRCHQLYTDLCIRVDLLEVIDQLRQILD